MDWFRADGLGRAMLDGIIADIERGMLLPPMQTVTGYCNLLCAAGARPIYMDDISKETAKTWDICLDFVNPALVGIAYTLGSDFVDFLTAFNAMKKGFAEGAFRFTVRAGCASQPHLPPSPSNPPPPFAPSNLDRFSLRRSP